MRKKLLTTLLISTMLLTACGTNNKTTEEKLTTELATKTDATTQSVEESKVTLTEETLEAMKQYIKDSETILFDEIFTNGVLSGEVQTQTRNKIEVCVNSGVTIADIDGKIFADRYTDEPMEELHLVKDSEDNWVEAEDTTYILGWNIQDFDNSLDLYMFLTNDSLPPVGTEGIVSNEYTYYTVSEDIKDVKIEGIKYDEIEGKSTTYIVKDNVLQSYVVEVEFSKENVRYLTTTTYYFDYSNKVLEMPEYTENK